MSAPSPAPGNRRSESGRLWYIREGDRELGPFSSRQLKELAVSGRVRSDDHVRLDGRSGWYRAAEIRGLSFHPSDLATTPKAEAAADSAAEEPLSAEAGTDTGSAAILLQVSHRDGSVAEFYLAQGMTIGRASSNTIPLPDDPEAERTHARVDIATDGMPLLRCCSAAGRIERDGSSLAELRLTPGLRFRIGQSEFVCRSGRRTEPAEKSPERSACPYCGCDEFAPEELPHAPERPVACPACGRPVFVLDLGYGPESPWIVPAQCGRFRLEGFVGRGGMGAVFRGVDQQYGQEVAIKLLLPEPRSDSRAIDRFRQEIETLQQLDHPHVVRLIDYGDAGGAPFLVTEWAEGGSLREVILEHARKGTFCDFYQALLWTKQICEGLAAIHEQGVIHRDLKPSNVLLDADGSVKIADLGVARPSGSNAGLTTTGVMPGTYEYMAPEQFSFPEAVDGRVDVYAIGVTLYELLTGMRPVGTWRAASSVNATVHAAFDAVVAITLSPNPDERYGTVHELAEVIGQFLAPRWAYRWRGGVAWNHRFEVRNLSCYELTNVVVDVTVHRLDGSERKFEIKAPKLASGAAHRRNYALNAEATLLGSEIGYITAKMQWTRGDVTLDEAAQKREADARAKFRARIEPRSSAAADGDTAAGAGNVQTAIETEHAIALRIAMGRGAGLLFAALLWLALIAPSSVHPAGLLPWVLVCALALGGTTYVTRRLRLFRTRDEIERSKAAGTYSWLVHDFEQIVYGATFLAIVGFLAAVVWMGGAFGERHSATTEGEVLSVLRAKRLLATIAVWGAVAWAVLADARSIRLGRHAETYSTAALRRPWFSFGALGVSAGLLLSSTEFTIAAPNPESGPTILGPILIVLGGAAVCLYGVLDRYLFNRKRPAHEVRQISKLTQLFIAGWILLPLFPIVQRAQERPSTLPSAEFSVQETWTYCLKLAEAEAEIGLTEPATLSEFGAKCKRLAFRLNGAIGKGVRSDFVDWNDRYTSLHLDMSECCHLLSKSSAPSYEAQLAVDEFLRGSDQESVDVPLEEMHVDEIGQQLLTAFEHRRLKLLFEFKRLFDDVAPSGSQLLIGR
jgi:hypothetical protein